MVRFVVGVVRFCKGVWRYVKVFEGKVVGFEVGKVVCR